MGIALTLEMVEHRQFYFFSIYKRVVKWLLILPPVNIIHYCFTLSTSVVLLYIFNHPIHKVVFEGLLDELVKKIRSN